MLPARTTFTFTSRTIFALNLILFLLQPAHAGGDPENPSDEVDFPSWFIPLYFPLLIIISILSAIMVAGKTHVASQTSTFLSVLTLITVDNLAYVTISLSAILLIFASIISKPWESITIVFMVPMGSLIVSLIYGRSMQVNDRSILTLWLRSATFLSVDFLSIDTVSLQAALQMYQNVDNTIITEDEVFPLMRTNRPGGVSSAAENNGSTRPFFTAFHMWLRGADTYSTSRALVMHRICGTKRPRLIARYNTAQGALFALEAAGRKRLRQLHEDTAENESVTIVSSLDGCVRRAPCKGFGRMWLRAARQPGLVEKSEGWWYIGADIVQSLKQCLGVKYLTAEGRFDDISTLWDWIDNMGYGWRKEFQLREVAGEIAHAALEDEQMVIHKSLALAGEGTDIDVSWPQRRLAVEANAVACLGLAVGVTIGELQFRLDEICERLVEILERIGEDLNGVWVVREPWPEEEVARLIFRWVGEAALASGRPGGPGLEEATSRL